MSAPGHRGCERLVLRKVTLTHEQPGSTVITNGWPSYPPDAGPIRQMPVLSARCRSYPPACSTDRCSTDRCSTDRCSTDRCSTDRCSTDRCSTDRCSTDRCSTDRCSTDRCSTDRCSTDRCSNLCSPPDQDTRTMSCPRRSTELPSSPSAYSREPTREWPAGASAGIPRLVRCPLHQSAPSASGPEELSSTTSSNSPLRPPLSRTVHSSPACTPTTSPCRLHRRTSECGAEVAGPRLDRPWCKAGDQVLLTPEASLQH